MMFFLIISIPFYFSTKYFPIFVFFLNLKRILQIKLNKNNFLYLISFLLLIISQIFFLEIKNYHHFFYKILAILLFYISYEFGLKILKKENIFLFKIQFFIVFIYAIITAPSYILDYTSFLPKFNCALTNISEINLLRCSTFGEGNLYGIYIVLCALLFLKSIKMLLLCLISSLISFSPIPIAIICSLIFFNFFKIYKLSFLVLLLITVFLVIIFFYSKNYSYSETSSFGERLEFILSGLRMFLHNPLLGVGLGQYGSNISEFTSFIHLIINSENGFRYIPNNVIIEVLSEQGIFGLILFIIFLKNALTIDINKITRIIIMISYISFFQACPTLYLYFIGIFMGFIKNYYKK